MKSIAAFNTFIPMIIPGYKISAAGAWGIGYSIGIIGQIMVDSPELKCGHTGMFFKESRKIGMIVITQLISYLFYVKGGVVQKSLRFKDKLMVNPMTRRETGKVSGDLIEVQWGDIKQ
jgi:hypothetical protein